MLELWRKVYGKSRDVWPSAFRQTRPGQAVKTPNRTKGPWSTCITAWTILRSLSSSTLRFRPIRYLDPVCQEEEDAKAKAKEVKNGLEEEVKAMDQEAE